MPFELKYTHEIVCICYVDPQERDPSTGKGDTAIIQRKFNL